MYLGDEMHKAKAMTLYRIAQVGIRNRFCSLVSTCENLYVLFVSRRIVEQPV